MKTTQTFSILIWANQKKSSKGLAPLYARVTINGRRAEISMKRKVNIDTWNRKLGIVTSSDPSAESTNNHITHFKAEILKIYNQMQVLEEDITAENIKLRFTGMPLNKKSLLQVIDYHNLQMEKLVNIDVSRGTLIKYKALRTKIFNFLRWQYKSSDIWLDKLNYQFITNFEYYLKTQLNNNHNSSMKVIKNFKKIINLSVQNNWLDKNPFLSFKCSFKRVDRQILSIEEILEIENKNFSIKRMQLVRDLFIFSCYTGLAYCDVMSLTRSNVVIGIDGNIWISTHRKKTDESVKVPLLAKALEILNKYKNDPAIANSEFLLPHFSNQKLNSYLKEVADCCGIDKNLTFHLARHTFATTVTLANGVPIETVSKLLGHSSIRTTQIYAKVIEKKVSEDMSLLQTKLASNNPKKLHKVL